MSYRDEVVKDYNKLKPYRGAKERAANIQGISGTHFRVLIHDDSTSKDTLMSLHQAIKQSAFEVSKKANELVKELKKVKV